MKKRIVVADDDPDIVTLLSLRLEQADYEVFAAHDGEAALDQMRRHAPHGAILDVRMPGTGGLAALQRIKADPAMAGTAVMLLTGERDPKTVMQALGAGASDYMVKPFDPDRLAARVGRMLQARPAAR
jgi:DNA-binding response OmpR family regulator